MLRVAWRCADQRTAGLVGRELVPLTLSAPPAGMTGAGAAAAASATELLSIWPTLVDKAVVDADVRVVLEEVSNGAPAAARALRVPRRATRATSPTSRSSPTTTRRTTLIVREVTAERVKAHFGAMVHGRVDRYEAPNVRALNFVMQGALGGGGPRSLRADSLGKTLGGALVRMEIDVPDAHGRSPARAPRRRLGRRDPSE